MILVKNLKNFHISLHLGKSGKIRILTQGGSSMTLVENWKYFHSLFLGKVNKENYFPYIPDNKKGFFRQSKYTSGRCTNLQNIFGKYLCSFFWQNTPGKTTSKMARKNSLTVFIRLILNFPGWYNFLLRMFCQFHLANLNYY